MALKMLLTDALGCEFLSSIQRADSSTLFCDWDSQRETGKEGKKSSGRDLHDGSSAR
ncbi:predicted protein [Uncinocarpus reesii 1704]|uniref:Uncharacterized protein n=1 Tax=Uncinocarpus reesii (strain UAMH 1704) TaxID=336963 RepID=C4JRA2_UNCRE|nr:uncharacterized protein UREG_04991 [Uncinocarpus reesii 1704]EEP80149.1 predicted protein [Uncinocarpus reesii 1704]